MGAREPCRRTPAIDAGVRVAKRGAAAARMRPVSAECRWHERFKVPLSTGARHLSSHRASLGVRQSR